MILTKEQIQNTIAEFFADKPVNKVWLFGSYARGEADEKSDVDVLVDFEKDAKVGLEYLVWHEEIEQLINKKVDVVSRNGLSKFIGPFIEKEKELIYEK